MRTTMAQICDALLPAPSELGGAPIAGSAARSSVLGATRGAALAPQEALDTLLEVAALLYRGGGGGGSLMATTKATTGISRSGGGDGDALALYRSMEQAVALHVAEAGDDALQRRLAAAVAATRQRRRQATLLPRASST